MQIHKEEFRDCVSESVTERELEVILMNALSTMPEKRRDVFILRKLRGMTTADVAALLGISTRTVEAHMSKALSDVRLAFSENFT
jgi:RNA polymerase sigma-70 factor (ECF subfamily)